MLNPSKKNFSIRIQMRMDADQIHFFRGLLSPSALLLSYVDESRAVD